MKSAMSVAAVLIITIQGIPVDVHSSMVIYLNLINFVGYGEE